MLSLSYSSILNNKDTDDSDKSGLHLSCENKRIEVVKLLIEHTAINLNIKDSDENSAFSLCYPNAKLARVMLETGKINLDQDNAVVNLVHKENGTIEFELKDWQVIMNSRDSVESIINKNTLFPLVNLLEDVSLTESDIKEGEKFLTACQNGDTEQVKKCLDLLNTSVLNRIDADYSDWTGLHYACRFAKLDV